MDPLELRFEVACGVDDAFELWTAKASVWWPADHTVSATDHLTITFEPHAGGRIYERTAEGAEHDWGEVVAWDPPHRLVYLWHLRSDRSDATEVEVRFEPVGDRTAVTIVHRGWERLGAAAAERRARNRQGWSGVIVQFQRACTSPT